MSQSDLEELLAYELIAFPIIWAFLHVRGWRLRPLGLDLSVTDLLTAAGLVVTVFAIWIVSWLFVWLILPEDGLGLATGRMQGATGLSPATVIAVSLVNGLYEEFFVAAYVLTALRGRTTMASAIGISAALRLLYHLYQGAGAVLDILPGGVLFAYWYGRTGRLWPLAFAHMALDLIALLQRMD